jgi:hypothetical protein
VFVILNKMEFKEPMDIEAFCDIIRCCEPKNVSCVLQFAKLARENPNLCAAYVPVIITLGPVLSGVQALNSLRRGVWTDEEVASRTGEAKTDRT